MGDYEGSQLPRQRHGDTADLPYSSDGAGSALLPILLDGLNSMNRSARSQGAAHLQTAGAVQSVGEGEMGISEGSPKRENSQIFRVLV